MGAPHLSEGLGVGSDDGRYPQPPFPRVVFPQIMCFGSARGRSGAPSTAPRASGALGLDQGRRGPLSLEQRPQPPPQEQRDFPDPEATLPLCGWRQPLAGVSFLATAAHCSSVCGSHPPESLSPLPSCCPCPQRPHRQRTQEPALGLAWLCGSPTARVLRLSQELVRCLRSHVRAEVNQQSHEVPLWRHVALHLPSPRWLLSSGAGVKGAGSRGPPGLGSPQGSAPPRVSFWESPFVVRRRQASCQSPRNHTARLLWAAASTQPTPRGPQTSHLPRHLQCDMLAQSCGPAADPCSHHLHASPWPPRARP